MKNYIVLGVLATVGLVSYVEAIPNPMPKKCPQAREEFEKKGPSCWDKCGETYKDVGAENRQGCFGQCSDKYQEYWKGVRVCGYKCDTDFKDFKDPNEEKRQGCYNTCNNKFSVRAGGEITQQDRDNIEKRRECINTCDKDYKDVHADCWKNCRDPKIEEQDRKCYSDCRETNQDLQADAREKCRDTCRNDFNQKCAKEDAEREKNSSTKSEEPKKGEATKEGSALTVMPVPVAPAIVSK